MIAEGITILAFNVIVEVVQINNDDFIFNTFSFSFTSYDVLKKFFVS
jgi:hypothetical protein